MEILGSYQQYKDSKKKASTGLQQPLANQLNLSQPSSLASQPKPAAQGSLNLMFSQPQKPPDVPRDTEMRKK